MSFYRHCRGWIAWLVLSLGLAGGAAAQIDDEERRQLRQEMREHWQQLPPIERQRLRQERRERRESSPSLAPEERRRLRDELRGRHEGGGGGGQFMEHRGDRRH